MNSTFSDLSITPRLIAEELTRRNVEFSIVNQGSSYALFQYKDDSGEIRLCRNVITDTTPAIATRIADNKYETYLIAKNLGISVPRTELFADLQQAHTFLEKNHTIVVKPLDSSHGNGVTTSLQDPAKLLIAVREAMKFSSVVLLQEQIEAINDIRLLFIDGEFRAATKRIPAFVIGDNVHTIEQLIEIENQPGKRSVGYSDLPSVIPPEAAENFLGSSYRNTTPSKGEQVQVIGTANIGTGGLAENMTDIISKSIVIQAKKIADVLQMPVCGVDFLVNSNQEFSLIEINASPSFGLHHYPNIGSSVNVTSYFVDAILKPRICI